MKKNRKQYFRGVIVSLVIALGLMMPTTPPQAQSNGNPGIIPPNAKPFGMGYGQWGAKWWQWLESIPASVNPNFDSTGVNCGQGQSGPVWFLPQSFGGDFNRTCHVPTGKAIFFPIFCDLFGSGVFDCDPTNPGVPCDVPTLRASAAAWMDNPALLEASIDGVPVQNLNAYRASSPTPFSITYPEDAVFGIPSGTYFPQVSDGYWLMLAPLSPGTHIIHIKAIANPEVLDFALEGTTTLIVGQ